jgi:hypothetical protein
LKGWLGIYKKDDANLPFYQYAFTKREFVKLIKAAGFEVLDVLQYDSYKGIVDELPNLDWILNKRIGRYEIGAVKQALLRKIPFVERNLGHMVMVVGRKPR